MARKDVLRKLMQAPEGKSAVPPPPSSDGADGAAPSASPAPPAPPRSTKGAVGAVGRSIADLKARAIVDVDPTLIDPAGMEDRLEAVEAEDAALRDSIAEHGQQVPVLLRPSPDGAGRYQVVYGRRRVSAMRTLGQPVKAMIRDLDDRQLVIAQGQENTARRDLSFIEKVNFARQLSEAGYDRKVIGDALQIDKTLISRMLSVAERTPLPVIRAIGAAPSVGRERWLKLAEALEGLGLPPDDAAAFAQGSSSDARFDSVFNELTRIDALRRGAEAKRPAPRRTVLRDASGKRLGDARTDRDRTILTFAAEPSQGFETWLVNRLPQIHRAWLQERGDAAEGDPAPDGPEAEHEQGGAQAKPR